MYVYNQGGEPDINLQNRNIVTWNYPNLQARERLVQEQCTTDKYSYKYLMSKYQPVRVTRSRYMKQ